MSIESPRAAQHSPHLDGLRTVLVGWVIAGHALLGYSAVGGWPYDEIHEVTFAPAVELALVAIIGPSGLFVIGVLFFVSGLLTERSLRRRGRAGYVRSRAIRLGLPWLASALLLWPTSLWLAYHAAGRPVSWWWVLTQRDPPLDSGSLWFALVLLIYSVGFALLPVPSGARRAGALTGRHLVLATAAITAGAFALRLVLPARSGQIGDLHLWQWPECLGMFVLGIVAARRGWDRHVPPRVARLCGASVLTALVLLPVLALLAGVRDVSRDVAPYLGGWHWQALLVAVVEATLTVGGAVWLVGWAERRRGGAGPSAVRWAPGAYLAFVIQGPVLLGVATALGPLPAPAELKAPVLAAVSVALCFWLGRRIPALVAAAGRRSDTVQPVSGGGGR